MQLERKRSPLRKAVRDEFVFSWFVRLRTPGVYAGGMSKFFRSYFKAVALGLVYLNPLSFSSPPPIANDLTASTERRRRRCSKSPCPKTPSGTQPWRTCVAGIAAQAKHQASLLQSVSYRLESQS